MSSGRLILFRNRHLGVLFSAPNGEGKGGGGLLGITNFEFAADLIRPEPSRGLAPSWQICLGTRRTDPDTCKPDGVSIVSQNLPTSWALTERSTGGLLRFRSTDASTGLQVTVDFELTAENVQARIESQVPASSELGVVSTRFPILAGAGRRLTGKEQLILPRYNFGIACDDCVEFHDRYPSMYQTMPWFGYLDGEHGLYVGAHDPIGRYKVVHAGGPLAKNPSYFETFPEQSGLPSNTSSAPGSFVIEPVCASRGWPALSHVYKSWVTQSTEWGRAQPVGARSDIPSDFLRGAWWFTHSINEKQSATHLSNTSEMNRSDFPGIPTVHHWYGWHLPGMDKGFPAFEPKSGTKQAVAAVQRDGRSRVILYTNGSMSDQSTAPLGSGRPADCNPGSSQYPRFWESTMIRANGERYFGKFSSGACLVRMDLASPLWREIVLRNIAAAANDLDAAGVYVDVTGNVAPGSWSGIHYPPGRGRRLTEAARALIRDARESGALIISEGSLEQLSGLNHAGVNYLDFPPTSVPLFQAVHHERYILAGTRSLPPDDEDALAIKNGLAIAWGLQPGLSSLQWKSTSEKRNVAWANRLIAARRALEPWLASGEYLGPLRPSSDESSTYATSASWSPLPPQKPGAASRRPAIETSLYRSLDGGYALIAVNVSRNPANVRYRLPPPLKDLVARTISHVELGQPVGFAADRVSSQEVVLSLPARSVAAVILESPPMNDSSERVQ